MNNQKSAFLSHPSSKYITAPDHGFRSVFTTWPSLLPAYTISYSAATGKPIESSKKKLSVLLALLLLLITSLAASLILAFLWFNAIQSEYTNESSVKINSNQASFDHHHHHHHHHHKSTGGQQSINSITSSTTSTSSSTTSPTTATENESVSSTSEDEDGFGEKENDNSAQTTPSSNNEQANGNHLINYYKNMRNELDRNNNKPTNKIRDEEKLDGEYVEHHTISDLPDDTPDELNSFLQPEQPVTSSTNHNDPNEVNRMSAQDYIVHQQTSEQNLNLPQQLIGVRAKQFCNLNSYVNEPKNSSYECRSNNNLNPSSIGSYFCNDKFVIVAKINSLKKEIVIDVDRSERQLISKYDVHIERILKRSPFLSVAFKKQGLTTNVTINLDVLANELRQSDGKTITCLGQQLELKLGQTYLLSGHIFGLSAVSGNCDLQLEWFNDLDEEHRNKLIAWSASRTSFSHC